MRSPGEQPQTVLSRHQRLTLSQLRDPPNGRQGPHGRPSGPQLCSWLSPSAGMAENGGLQWTEGDPPPPPREPEHSRPPPPQSQQGVVQHSLDTSQLCARPGKPALTHPKESSKDSHWQGRATGAHPLPSWAQKHLCLVGDLGWQKNSGSLVIRVALQLVELDAVQLLEALPAVLAGEVVVDVRGVLFHVPVQGGPLPALVATDLTPAGGSPSQQRPKGSSGKPQRPPVGSPCTAKEGPRL